MTLMTLMTLNCPQSRRATPVRFRRTDRTDSRRENRAFPPERRGSRRGKTRQATLVENPSHERPRLDAPSVVTVSFASVALGVPQFRGDEDDFPRGLERSSVRAIL